MNRLIRILLLSLLPLLFATALAACGGETVYVVVTATPDSGAAGAALPTATPSADDEETGSTVPLPPSPTAANEAPAEPAATPEPAGAAQPPLDPAAGRIAFMGPFGDGGNLHAYVANADGSGLTYLSETLDAGFFPNLSPDGSKLALTASSETGDADLFVVDVATGESTNLTNSVGQDIQAIWSPDGSQIAFVSEREGGDADIWLMNADGSEPRRLARTTGDDQLGSWSPDAQQIAYSNRSELGESLWILDVATGESRQLTENAAGADSAPAWSPDGERIAFYSAPNDAPPQLYTIRPDGSEQTQITEEAEPAVFPVWSPDGQSLLYTTVGSNNQFNMVVLNLETQARSPVPNVSGLPTSWRAVGEPLAETDVTQGPKQTAVTVDPAVLEAAYRKGSPDAPVTIIEFSDYQCPFCQRWVNDTYSQLLPYIEDGTVQLIFVDFPLTIHPQAPAAAQAARCAGELGGTDAYWAMHDALFGSLDRWSGQQAPAPIFATLATEAGLDGAELQGCVESGRYEPQVNAGLQEGIRLGVSGTPTFFINGTRLVGAQPFEAFAQYLPAN